jgi:chromosome segregation ATPase
MFLFEEEKNRLINNLNDKESEYNSNKKKYVEISKQLEDFKSILNQKMEEVEKLKENNSKFENNLNLANLEIEQKKENIKQMEEKYNILKNETINNPNVNSTPNKGLISNNANNELINVIESKNELFKDKVNLEKQVILLKNDIRNLEKEIIKSKNENDNLQNKIKQLSEENLNINESNNQINNKYHELKKKINEKDKEIQDSKEMCAALIEKQKKQVEEENKVDPNNYKIITSKKYKKLTWYLICKKNKTNKDSIKNSQNQNQNVINEVENIDENNYINYKWVTGLIIKRDQLEKFNKFETDEEKLNNYQELIFDFKKKLEKKEESISRLEFKNKKLNEQVHNKTANVKGIIKNNMIGNVSKNTTLNNNMIKNNSEMDENRISQLQTENSRLKDEIKAKEKLMLGVKDINNIDLQDDNSGFLDEDLKENKAGGGVLDFIKSKNDIFDEINSKKSGAPAPGVSARSQISSINDYKISERKVDEFLSKGVNEDNDLDIGKQIQGQLNFLKKEIKEKDNKFNSLSEQVKELLKNIKCDMKNKPQVVQICQLLGISQETMNKIVANKKNIIF